MTVNGADRMQGLIPEAYQPFAQAIFATLGTLTAVTNDGDMAEAVWRAANDASGQSRGTRPVRTRWRGQADAKAAW